MNWTGIFGKLLRWEIVVHCCFGTGFLTLKVQFTGVSELNF